MFWTKTILTTLFVPFTLSLFFFIKEFAIDKGQLTFKLLHKKSPGSFSLTNLILAFFLVSLSMFCLYFTLGVYSIWDSTDKLEIVSHSVVYIFVGTMFFLAIYKNSINRYRKPIFILFAIAFSIGFMSDIYEARGHLYAFTRENIVEGEIPICQIGLMQSLLPALFKQTLLTPGKIFYNGIGISYSIIPVLIMWFATSLALGRGWCSWACFWGGWEDGFSSIKKKKVIKKCNPKFKLFPFALLIVVLLSSFMLMTPTFCWWLCPFKTVSEGPELSFPITIIQTAVFLSLFIGLIIVLPILTKKRTQCAFFCPFGAFQSIVDRINIFTVKIDRENCIDCKKCINECPVSSISEKSLSCGKVGITCTKCGQCIDVCPKNAISYSLKGVTNSGKVGRVLSTVTRYIFLFVAFFFISLMGGGTIIAGLYRLLLFFTTGSFV